MPRLRLDPFSPSGVSIASTTTEVVRQAPGYVSNKVTGLITAGSNVTITGNGTDSSPYSISSSGTGGTTPDATTTSKGIVQLAGDLAGTAALPILKDTIGSSGTSGSSGTVIPVISYDAKGRITALSSAAVSSTGLTLTESQVTNLTTDLAAKQATLSLTTTGTSGAATLVGATLNIPQYSGGGGTTLPADAAGWLHDNGTGTLAWTTPTQSDVGLGNVDNTTDASKAVLSASKLTTSRAIDGIAFDGSADISLLAPAAHAATSKTTPVDADEIAITDSAASFVLKKLTWANLKATIKTYYDSVVSTVTNKDLTSGTNTFPTFNQNTTGSAAKWTTPRTLAGNSVDGSANATFANKFIVQGTTDAGLSAAQFLGALSTGLLKNTTTTGVLSIATAGTDYVVPGGALGTPSSGTLTNATGLPIAGLTASTTTALGVGSIELGNATDTTLSRSSAGVLAVEGVVIPSISSTNALTNKDLTSTTNTFPNGTVVQIVSTNYSAVATGTTTIPNDDTIPQITEGTQFMSQAITPKSTTNKLVIEVVMAMGISSNGNRIAALFQDSTANALAATRTYVGNFADPVILTMRHTLTAGTTSATTFTVRGGSESAGTWTFNGSGGVRSFGGATLSNITITEYKA